MVFSSFDIHFLIWVYFHHRNQTSAPEYVFLISDVAGEKRFASVVARRLERLGALTHGDRRVTESRDLSMVRT